MSTSAVRVRAVSRLCWLLAVLSAFAAVAGILTDGGGGRRVVETVRGATVTLYGEGLYEFDTLLVGAGNRGQDLVILLVEVPALLLGAGLAQLTADIALTPAKIVAKMLSFTVLTVVAGGLLATLHLSARSNESARPAQMASPAER
jgi:hypothetical protein